MKISSKREKKDALIAVVREIPVKKSIGPSTPESSPIDSIDSISERLSERSVLNVGTRPNVTAMNSAVRSSLTKISERGEKLVDNSFAKPLKVDSARMHTMSAITPIAVSL